MICGLVLASGLSRRMGKDKLLLPWRGKLLIEHLIANITQAPLAEVLIVSSIERLKRLKTTNYKYTSIINPNPSLGMGNSLALGIRNLPATTEAVIVLLGDQPEMDVDDVVKVKQLFEQVRGKKVIIQTQYRDGIIGHPILFSKHFFTELSQLHGDVGGKGIIQSNLQSVVIYQSQNAYPADIDTNEDYKRLLKREKKHKQLKERRIRL